MSFGVVLAWAAGAVAALMFALWLVSVRVRDVSIVDPAWGPMFVVVAVVAAVAGDGAAGRRWLLLAMTALWGLRLGSYLLARSFQTARRTGGTRGCAGPKAIGS